MYCVIERRQVNGYDGFYHFTEYVTAVVERTDSRSDADSLCLALILDSRSSSTTYYVEQV